jgi:hypothetical protein
VGPRLRLQVRASYKRTVKPLLRRAPKRPPNVSSRREPRHHTSFKRRFAHGGVRRDSARRREEDRRYHGASAEVEKVNARLEAGALRPRARWTRSHGTGIPSTRDASRRRRAPRRDRRATGRSTTECDRRIERESPVHRRYGLIFAVSRKAQASVCRPCKDQSRCR